jgi:hypothetical protein
MYTLKVSFTATTAASTTTLASPAPLVVTSCGTIQEVAMVPHMVPIGIGKVLVQSNALSGLQVK